MSGINIKEQLAQRKVKSESIKSDFSIEKLLKKEFRLFPFKFSDKHKESFYLELSTLLTAGLDIKASLELIEGEQNNVQHTALIRGVKDNLINGSALWEAMAKVGHFTPYEFYSIQIGEETGKLTTVLNQLHHMYATKLKQRRQLMSALSYPVIILTTSIGAVAFMLLFIVPMFNDVFKRFGGELPQLTRLIIGFAEFVQANIVLIVLVLAGVTVILQVNRRQIWMRKFSARLAKRIPVIGDIFYSIQLARFCSSLSLLLGSKVPMMHSIKLVQQMIYFYPIHETLDAIERDVFNGRSLHASMSEFKIYDRKMISLIKVGEEVNKLDVFFDKLSQQYSSNAEHKTGMLNSFLEPLMIIFLGLVVGFILLAMYLPMFELSTSIGR